jgi:hypothetical protein
MPDKSIEPANFRAKEESMSLWRRRFRIIHEQTILPFRISIPKNLPRKIRVGRISAY